MIEVSPPSVTVTVTLALTVSAAPVIILWPGPTPVTNPLSLILAMLGVALYIPLFLSIDGTGGETPTPSMGREVGINKGKAGAYRYRSDALSLNRKSLGYFVKTKRFL